MSAALGVWLKYQGDFDAARNRLEAAHEAAIEEGDESSLPYVVGHLPQLELWTGNWSDADTVLCATPMITTSMFAANKRVIE